MAVAVGPKRRQLGPSAMFRSQPVEIGSSGSGRRRAACCTRARRYHQAQKLMVPSTGRRRAVLQADHRAMSFCHQAPFVWRSSAPRIHTIRPVRSNGTKSGVSG
jgi:hypothetical protein